MKHKHLPPPLWVTKDGRALRPREMSLTHLRNTVEMLQRELVHLEVAAPTLRRAATTERRLADIEKGDTPFGIVLDEQGFGLVPVIPLLDSPIQHAAALKSIYDAMVEEIRRREELLW